MARLGLGSRIRQVLDGARSPAADEPDFVEAERRLLDLERLQAIARERREAYAAAEPFPHTVIDGLFDDAVLERVAREFSTESPKSITESLPGHVSGKRSVRDHLDRVCWTPFVRFFVSQLNSMFYLSFLRELTGIPDLISDPYLDGAGLHETLPGGWLDVHADFNFHGVCFLDRRVNLLVYLNRDWREEWGGHLELWDRELRECRARIAPTFNRTVIFNTSDISFHGHPEPLRCPPGESRKSLALYYFSNGRPESERSPWHSTIWRGSD